MEDDKLKELFRGFEPELTSGFQFMARLQQSIDAVELVKQHSVALRRRNKVAVVIAALSGFLTGVLLTLLFPLVGDWISTIQISIPHFGFDTIVIDCRLFGWILLAVVSAFTALNAYEIAMSKLPPKGMAA